MRSTSGRMRAGDLRSWRNSCGRARVICVRTQNVVSGSRCWRRKGEISVAPFADAVADGIRELRARAINLRGYGCGFCGKVAEGPPSTLAILAPPFILVGVMKPLLLVALFALSASLPSLTSAWAACCHAPGEAQLVESDTCYCRDPLDDDIITGRCVREVFETSYDLFCSGSCPDGAYPLPDCSTKTLGTLYRTTYTKCYKGCDCYERGGGTVKSGHTDCYAACRCELQQ